MTNEAISKINERYQLLLVDIADDDPEDRALVEELLDRSGLHNRRRFDSLDEYQRALEENPNLTPHIALLDFRPSKGSDLTGLQITIMLMKRSKSKSLRTKAVIISGMPAHPKIIRKFFRVGGFDWLDKNDHDYKDQLTETIMDAIIDVQEALEERAWIDGLEEDVLK
jgi:DNA-binding NtrC family response regulator